MENLREQAFYDKILCLVALYDHDENESATDTIDEIRLALKEYAALERRIAAQGAGVCPHYFEATDGVHVVVVGRCRCDGRLSAAPVAPVEGEQSINVDDDDETFGGPCCDVCGFDGGHYPDCPKRKPAPDAGRGEA